jgi:HPt (histidine-containing phosphotransfer) domain-containing protein
MINNTKQTMINNTQQTNIKQLNTISSEDNEFKKELIGIFQEQIPEFISNMNRFLAEGDLNNLAKVAHTAKSSVLVFGMTHTGKSLKKIQLQSENKEPKQLKNLIKSVTVDLKEANKELHVILDQI